MTPETGQMNFTAAYFDVDETLLAAKSMFSFLRFYLHERGDSEDTYHQLRSDLANMAQLGATREEINRQYYRLYAGETVEHLQEVGQRWGEQLLERPDVWLPSVEHFVAYQKAGARTVLISGSFFACLDPIAAELGPDAVYCTTPIVDGGVLTGEVRTPMIGAAKAEALTLDRRRNFIARSSTVAYGDHSSDLPMLEAAGYGVVASTDPVLRAASSACGWSHVAAPMALTA